MQEREFFLRLFDRFIDTRELNPGDVAMNTSFNLGKYFMIRCSQDIAEILEISNFDWCTILVLALIPFVGYWTKSTYTDVSVDIAYVTFWIYNVSAFLLALLVDWKLHSIMIRIVPLVVDFAHNCKCRQCQHRLQGVQQSPVAALAATPLIQAGSFHSSRANQSPLAALMSVRSSSPTRSENLDFPASLSSFTAHHSLLRILLMHSALHKGFH